MRIMLFALSALLASTAGHADTLISNVNGIAVDDQSRIQHFTGLLIGDDGTRRGPGPVRIDGATPTGDGWAVTVATGWTVRRGPRPGDYQIVRAGTRLLRAEAQMRRDRLDQLPPDRVQRIQ